LNDTEELHTLAWLLGSPCPDSQQELTALAAEHDWLRGAVQELQTLPLEEWQGEHTRLFVTGYPTTPCPPFESAYLNGCLGGAAQYDLERLFQSLGLEATEAPADYLGSLLEGVAWLQDQGSHPEVLQELQDKHLGRWANQFAQDLQQHSSLELYRVMGERLADHFPPRLS